jgi:hypothetical protein
MSRLEGQAKPVLESILDDKVTSLGISAQTTLARWSVKTVMVLEAIDSNRSWFYSAGERQSMCATLSIPARTSVWIAKCVEQPNIYSAARDLRTSPGGDEAHAFLSTLAFGSLAIQVLSIRTSRVIPVDIPITYEVREGPWEQTLVPVWPTSQDSQAWPPHYGLAGEFGLDELSARLSQESVNRGRHAA